jgi:hypothetical protein
MALFKARQQAGREVERALAETGRTLEEVRGFIARQPRYRGAFHRSPHALGCTAADLVYEVGSAHNPFRRAWKRITGMVRAPGRLGDLARRAATASKIPESGTRHP